MIRKYPVIRVKAGIAEEIEDNIVAEAGSRSPSTTGWSRI